MPSVELFGTSSCPYTTEMREWLEWKGKEFAEYDVQTNQVARERMKLLAQAPYTVPLLVEDGKVVQVGWQGRGCTVNVGAVNASMAGPAQGSTQ
jgi:glutaredoxin